MADHPPTVALYFYRLGGAGGGAERMICQLAGALAQRGFDVYLVSWDAPDAQSFYPISPAVQWVRLGFAHGLSGKLRRAWALYQFLKSCRIQTLVGFVMSADRTVYAAARFAGVKLVVAERNAPLMYMVRYSPMRRWLIFSLLGLAERITVQLDSFVPAYPARLHARIHSIPNPVPGVDLRAHPEQAGANGRFTLLAVARLEPVQKRIACLVRAFARIAHDFPAWDLLIVGDGPESGEVLRLIQAHGLQGRVCIKTSTPAIFEIYAQSHLFVIPSRWEGFSNALAEAMSHGLPAVGFAQAEGVAELIADGGWLAPGLDDEAALAASLTQAMADSGERARRGCIAVQRMAQFEPERQFDRWAELLRSVITSAEMPTQGATT